MEQYGSWISVSQFYVQVCADNKEEAREKIMDALETISVKVLEEGKNGYTELKCKVNEVEEV